MAYRLSEEQEKIFYDILEELCKNSMILESCQYMQHGSTSVFRHSVSVAYVCYYLAEKMNAPVDTKSLIRGALLHDYFLYDWHKPDLENPHKLHGFYHPGKALRNASREYKLTEREKDIIKKHMWPLTVVPPACREAWIVTMADKWCSLMETLHMHKGHGVLREELYSYKLRND